jgi:hypothetical protein
MAELEKEEEEKVGCSWDHTTKKGTHMYHPSVM